MYPIRDLFLVVGMECGIDADAALDYATIQIFPAQNRYEVFVCGDDEVEKVATGLLEHLLPHLPGVKNLHNRGSNANFKLQVPGQKDTTWFTKSTLNRFLQIVASADLVNSSKLIEGEMSQLKEARKFHLSLYTQGHKDQFESGETGTKGIPGNDAVLKMLNCFPVASLAKPVIIKAFHIIQEAKCLAEFLIGLGYSHEVSIPHRDGSNSVETLPTHKPEVEIASSDTSKDELLRAMDLRLTALRRELAAALNQAAGATCSSKDITNIIEFCDNFGAADLKNFLSKCFELRHNSETALLTNDDKHSFTCMSRRNNANKTNGETHISISTQLQTPVKYGVSPAMVAQVERHSSTESEESSNSSNEDQISAERSRTLTRSVQPRRSASPMRRIQIARTGSRRTPALSIKNLGHYPARERIPYYRDGAANGSEDEGSEQFSKKPEKIAPRMTVQDAINLFESKQKDQSADAQTRICSSNLSLFTNKSVLRRWSASTIEGSAPYQQELVSEKSALLSSGDVMDEENSNLSCGDVMDEENSNLSVKEKLESDVAPGCRNLLETTKVDVELKRLEKETHDQLDVEEDTSATPGQESNGMPAASAEWTQQKEVELNPMMKKTMESQPVRTRKPQTSRNQNIPSDYRGGFYDHYKEKRDEKLRGENAGKKAEKEARFRALQQTLDERKAEMVSRSVKDVGKKHPSPKPQKSLKNPSQSASLRNESPKSSVARKVSTKKSTLPATRKSWPTPSTRVAGPSPSKTPSGNSLSGTTQTRRKPQSTSSLPRSSAKVERSQPCLRNVKESQTDTDRSLKGGKEKMQQKVTKSGKTTGTKVSAATADCSSMVQSMPSFYNKMTRKSTVVPLESKPLRRKGSGVAVGIGPTVSKTKHSSRLEDSSMNCGNTIETLSNKVTVNASTLLSPHQDQDIVSSDNSNPTMGLETMVTSHQNGDESENIIKLATDLDDSFKDTAESTAMFQCQEESVISPIAWEEIDEHQNMQNSYDDCTSQLASPVHVAPLGLSSPRIRHSLSQMLQEDNSEPEIVEWGNAENPPAMVYQKDAPKGLKRLLKFARKSKGDASLTGLSSPSVFSEGEDDAEESKAISKRSTDTLLKKVALHSKNNGQQNATFFVGHEKNVDPHELHSAQSSSSKFEVQSSHKLPKGHGSSAASTTKATRSFFSLSAFRGSKPNEMKFH